VKKVLLGTPAEEPERLLWTKKKEQQSQWYLVDLLCNGVAVVRKEEERNNTTETMKLSAMPRFMPRCKLTTIEELSE
jgi:hypothetical protein